jgi:hypothetical protein
MVREYESNASGALEFHDPRGRCARRAPRADAVGIPIAAVRTPEVRSRRKRQKVHFPLRLVSAALTFDEQRFRASCHAHDSRTFPHAISKRGARILYVPLYKEIAMGTEWVLVLLLKVGEYEMSTIPGFVSEARCREAGEQWKVDANKFRGISGGQYLCLRKNNT